MEKQAPLSDISVKQSSNVSGVPRACVAVAEDDTDMRELIGDALRRDGHHVIELSTGVQLLIHMAHQFLPRGIHPRVQLIVSDIRMPAMTGIELLRGLRQGQCTIPVILMTAFGDARTRAEGEALGAVMLDKPLSIPYLRAEVRRLLGEHAA